MGAATSLRVLAAVAAVVGGPLIGAAVLGPTGAVAAAAIATATWLWAWLWLPRAAHAAFRAGRAAAARRRYRALAALALGARRRRAAWLSLAACDLAVGEVAAATRRLGASAPEGLAPAERAVWLNNRAYAALLDGRPGEAAPLLDEALGLRPDVAALHHTRGLLLLALGRVDEAIAVLDGLRAEGDLGAALEAARCRALAEAWRARGEAAYAEDYEARAHRLAGG